jgi:hypothetical protein
VLPPCAQSSDFYAIHNTTIGLVNNGCLALELAKKQLLKVKVKPHRYC